MTADPRADQVAAARREAHQTRDRLIEELGSLPVSATGDRHQVRFTIEILHRHRDSETKCKHLLAAAPQPEYTALWAPGRYYCRACALNLVAGIPEGTDQQCDRCGAPAPQLRLGTVLLGFVTVYWALCDECLVGFLGTTR